MQVGRPPACVYIPTYGIFWYTYPLTASTHANEYQFNPRGRPSVQFGMGQYTRSSDPVRGGLFSNVSPRRYIIHVFGRRYLIVIYYTFLRTTAGKKHAYPYFSQSFSNTVVPRNPVRVVFRFEYLTRNLHLNRTMLENRQVFLFI